MSALPLLLAAVVSSSAPSGVLLDFTATWCGPCQQMSPIVSKLEREGFPIQRVDANRDSALVAQYRISGFPTFVLLIDGQEQQRIVGMTDESNLRQMLAKIPQKPVRPSVTERPKRKTAVPVMTVAQGGAAEQPKSGFTFPLLKKFTGGGEDSNAAVAIDGDSQPRPAKPAQPATREMRHDPALLTTTRIRVKDAGGINYGTGTIIEYRDGRATILTCGHVFRNLSKDATIAVDVFEGAKYREHLGQILDFDLNSDVGLVVIAADKPLPVSAIAPATAHLVEGDRLISAGCGNGTAPTRLDVQVTGFDLYNLPNNIECTGLPVPGRSGGGLFNSRGEVVGVCFAADPSDKRGLYSGLKTIHALLDRAKLTYLYRGQEPTAAPVVQTIADAGDSSASEPTDIPNVPPFEEAFSEPEVETVAVAESSATEGADADDVRQLLNETEGMEVICIVRPRNKQKGKGRVVVVHQASSKFVSYLTGEVQDGRVSEEPGLTAAAEANGVEPAVLRKSRSGAASKDESTAAASSPRQPTTSYHRGATNKTAAPEWSDAAR